MPGSMNGLNYLAASLLSLVTGYAVCQTNPVEDPGIVEIRRTLDDIHNGPHRRFSEAASTHSLLFTLSYALEANDALGSNFPVIPDRIPGRFWKALSMR